MRGASERSALSREFFSAAGTKKDLGRKRCFVTETTTLRYGISSAFCGASDHSLTIEIIFKNYEK